MKRFIVVLALSLFSTVCIAQKVQQELPKKTRILFLLDGSGSMLAKWGETNRMEAAKSLLADLVDSLQSNIDLELALRAYGHRYSRGAQNCTDTKLEVGFSKNNHRQITDRLATIQPKGTTPIAYSLEQAAGDFPISSGYRNIIIIITDGIESCDGDPCDVSIALQKKGIFLKPFIIGIGMDLKYKKQFDCIGEFYDAKDIGTFRKALSRAISTSLDKTTASVLLYDENNKPTESNLNISFINEVTQVPVFDFVHYLDQNGQPDSVVIDPVLSYNIVANTIPPVVKRKVYFKPGQHNVIKINTPQGALKLNQSGIGSYNNGLTSLIKKGSKIIHNQSMNTTERYLVGKYNIEVLSLPKREFKNVEITQGKTTTITLPAPGLLNLFTNASGYGSIYEIMDDSSQQWIYNLNHEEAKTTITLQPGTYKIVFRVDRAPGSKYTTTKTIKITSGKSTTAKIFD